MTVNGPGAHAAALEVARQESHAAGYQAGAIAMLQWMMERAAAELAATPKYGDTRGVTSIQRSVEDKLREVQRG